MSAMAAARMSSRNQWRIRRRRTDWYGNPAHEHERRKLDHPLALALDEVHEYRDGNRREPHEEQRA